MNTSHKQTLSLVRAGSDPRFDGVGAVNGGGATSVLLKDYPEPQRSQILDLVFRPKFGASVSAMLVEIPGDGNSTQGSMLSHSHERGDLHDSRGYTWWVLREASARRERISLDAVAWSAPGWVGDGEFWSQDMADYYVDWLTILREKYALELDAIGCRNEKGVNLPFAKLLRSTLDANDFSDVRLHAFDDWTPDKFEFVRDLVEDADARSAIDIIGVHVIYDNPEAQIPADIRELTVAMGKPIWNTEDHVYKDGFDCLISIVECFNENFLLSGTTKTILWYDVAGVYPLEPYSVEPAMILAHQPWSGHYVVRDALWGYAHYGQFTELGWQYVRNGSMALDHGGTVVALASDEGEYSLIIESKNALLDQTLRIEVGEGLRDAPLCVWRSNSDEQFVRLADVLPQNGLFEFTVAPNSVYSISTTVGQQKGSFADVPEGAEFPFPYRDDFSSYLPPEAHGMLPRYTADIAGAFELTPSSSGLVLQQRAPIPTNSWAPDWHPFTIFGDEDWSDIEVSASVLIPHGNAAAVMARVNDVGMGYGFVPKCYYLELDHESWRLVSVNGKIDKSELIGDAEQQAAILARRDSSPGGEQVIAEGTLPPVGHEAVRTILLQCKGPDLTCIVDGVTVAQVTHGLHGNGMAGLLARANPESLSMPSILEFAVSAPGQEPAHPTSPPAGWRPMYQE